MSPLADVQRRLRQVVVSGEALGADRANPDPAADLIGGRNPSRRLAIHRRHYQTSLMAAILDRFPATTWLAGASRVTEVARAFVGEHPPPTPCLAEYGADYPAFLSLHPAVDRFPYVGEFAALEWHLGRVSVAIDRPPLEQEAFGTIERDRLCGVVLVLQPGVYYLRASWPVDELMRFYLTDTAPDSLVLDPADVCLEVRGARGAFEITRLDPDAFVFRAAVQMGTALGDAAERALDVSPAFDPSRALAALVNAGLAVALITSTEAAAAR